MSIDHTADMNWVPFTIPATGRDSEAFDGKGKGIAAIIVFGTYVSGYLSFMSQVEKDGTYYEEWLDDGNRMGLTSANMQTNKIIRLAPDATGVGFKHKFRIHTEAAQTTGLTGFILLRGF